ncbi:hypothetical protein IFM89_022153 [Coptis chinensis]|uniref:EF-hand domain-containing protein n=1 Tax=Coptis chinensis TaxID=261450 RepID=A0A835HXL0_9MAGN|nr:hypothetical protein IFM89_022153 [Coptis chinensis]
MSLDGGLTVLDGTTLRETQLHIPNTNGITVITGAELITIAETQASSSLFNISLPQTLISNALKRLNIADVDTFHSKEFKTQEEAFFKLKDYVIAIADELKDDPMVVCVLDGSAIRLFLEDEDDFAMLAENLFTDLDVADIGKIKKNEIRNALVHMGVELGVPPFSEFCLLEDILKKHGAEGEEELGQAQFAESLQPVLQDLADALAEKHIVIVQNIKINNGSKLRKLLADDEQLNSVMEKILHGIGADNDKTGCIKIIRDILEKSGSTFGIPPPEGNEAVVLLYDQVFAEVDNEKTIDRDHIKPSVKDILQKFSEQLEANPIFHGLDS